MENSFCLGATMGQMSLRQIVDTTPIVFLGRYPSAEDRKDGYYQRVAAIDRSHGALPRVYVRTDGPATMFAPSTRLIESGCWEVRVSRRNPLHRRSVTALAAASRGALAHSIRALESPLASTLFRVAPRRVLDLHGAVPEEAAMLGEADRVAEWERRERETIANVDLMIGVSRKLIEHIIEKHRPRRSPEQLVLPIVTEIAEEAPASGREGAIYAGGFQAWQQIDTMFEFVHRNPSLPVTFLTPDPERVRHEYRVRFGAEFPGTSDSASPEDLGGWYRRHRFGLILRQDSIVNRVASPTKLVEYLGSGLVPIVDSRDIGDFPDLGYRSVRFDEALPDPDEAERMAEANRVLFDTLVDRYRDGAEALRTWWVR